MLMTAAAIIAASWMLVSCAPVLDKNIMEGASRDVSFAALRESPAQSQGRVFIMGGVIVRTKFTEEGTQIEAMHVPVDRYGAFEDSGRSEGRFIALTGEFIGTRTGRIDEMSYTYPLFRIRQVYLWKQKKKYDHPPHFYDRWFYPYPYYYRNPWWHYPQKHSPVPTHPSGPPRSLPAPK
jgi:outer membrane lipoprotein